MASIGYKRVNGICLTRCPHGVKTKNTHRVRVVGSGSCVICKHYNGGKYQKVDCAYPKVGSYKNKSKKKLTSVKK
jgi:hypothetical protein